MHLAASLTIGALLLQLWLLRRSVSAASGACSTSPSRSLPRSSDGASPSWAAYKAEKHALSPLAPPPATRSSCFRSPLRFRVPSRSCRRLSLHRPSSSL